MLTFGVWRVFKSTVGGVIVNGRHRIPLLDARLQVHPSLFKTSVFILTVPPLFILGILPRAIVIKESVSSLHIGSEPRVLRVD